MFGRNIILRAAFLSRSPEGKCFPFGLGPLLATACRGQQRAKHAAARPLSVAMGAYEMGVGTGWGLVESYEMSRGGVGVVGMPGEVAPRDQVGGDSNCGGRGQPR